ncbi:MAG: acyl carrier protein [Candidatus Omnitrophica bacterium]|nr:acyl carrier protein [Candidatus Omnitrophota bacterium]
MEQKLRNIMAEVFDVPVDEIKEDLSAHTLANWDSLKHINLILALQKEFGVRFEDEEIPTMISYAMILNTLRAYLEV